MPGRPRRTVEEIVQLHAREGSRQQEVFVEGIEDKHFYEHFLRQSGFQEVAVLPIDTVEVPTRALIDMKLADGQKGRIVALAALLGDKVKTNEVVCIADADADHFFDRNYELALLLLTDYTSIELYAHNADVLGKVLGLGVGGFPKKAEQLLLELKEPLELAFLVRVAATELGLSNDAFPPHSSYCRLNDQKTAALFNFRDYTNTVFQRQNNRGWRDELDKALSGLRGRLKQDSRLQINGHDFRDSVISYIRQHKGAGDINASTMDRLFLALIDFDILRKEKMFLELLRRLGSK
jgi:hypothetical protein